jgi:hypothetical protein
MSGDRGPARLDDAGVAPQRVRCDAGDRDTEAERGDHVGQRERAVLGARAEQQVAAVARPHLDQIERRSTCRSPADDSAGPTSDDGHVAWRAWTGRGSDGECRARKDLPRQVVHRHFYLYVALFAVAGVGGREEEVSVWIGGCEDRVAAALADLLEAQGLAGNRSRVPGEHVSVTVPLYGALDADGWGAECRPGPVDGWRAQGRCQGPGTRSV